MRNLNITKRIETYTDDESFILTMRNLNNIDEEAVTKNDISFILTMRNLNLPISISIAPLSSFYINYEEFKCCF